MPGSALLSLLNTHTYTHTHPAIIGRPLVVCRRSGRGRAASATSFNINDIRAGVGAALPPNPLPTGLPTSATSSLAQTASPLLAPRQQCVLDTSSRPCHHRHCHRQRQGQDQRQRKWGRQMR